MGDKVQGILEEIEAEAKRKLYDRVDIDMFAGPTEIATTAGVTADPDWVACGFMLRPRPAFAALSGRRQYLPSRSRFANYWL